MSTYQQAIQQLEALGYRQGDRVYIRCLVAKNLPVQLAERLGLNVYTDQKGVKKIGAIDGYLTLDDDRTTFTQVFGSSGEKKFGNGWSRLRTINKSGYGIYLVVNPGGKNDNDITEARSLFYESDNVGKGEQWQRLQQLEQQLGSSASLVVETRKSLHTYFVLDRAIAPTEFERYQQRLIQCQDSDPSIYNEARLMRLAGFDHQAVDAEVVTTWQAFSAGDEYASGLNERELLQAVFVATPVRIVQQSDQVFSLADFDEVLPEWDERRWDKKRRGEGDRIATDAGDDPWDIRNLAHYLEGYRPGGRRGWITCKCPVHNGESDNSLHIEESSGAFKCHGGCDSKEVYNEVLRLAKLAGHVIPEGTRRRGQSGRSPLPSYELSYAPDVVVNSKYLGNVAIPDSAKLVALRAPKGSGKTERIAAMVSEAIGIGQRVLVITYREQLGSQLAERFGVPYKTEVRRSPEGKLIGYVCCIDSLHPKAEVPFTAEGTQHDLVIIDECESVIWHTLNSSTCTDRRVPILKELQSLLKGVLSFESRGRLVLADADLSDLSIQFALGMAGQPELKPYVILNAYKPEKGWDVYTYEKPADVYTAMVRLVLSGGRHLILTTGQKVDSKWGTKTLEKKLKSMGFHVLRVDSETIADPNHPAFQALMGDFNEVIKPYDVVICSPTIESGVSIDLKDHFSAVWGFFAGVTPENSVRQFLARLRDVSVPRHIYVNSQGINTAFVGNRANDAKSLIEGESDRARRNLAYIKDACFTVDEDGSITSNTSALETWGKMGARINQGLENYEASVIAGLKAEGHTIHKGGVCLDKQESKLVSDEVGAIRDENQKTEAEAIAVAPMPADEAEYEDLKGKRAKTEQERRSQRLYELNRRYGVDVTPALVLQDDGGWHPLIRVHYYLTGGYPYLRTRDAKKLEAIAGESLNPFLPDVNKNLINSKINALKILGIDNLLSEGEEFYQSHPVIEAITKQARECAADVQRYTGVKVTANGSNMAIVNEILSQCLGFRLKKDGQKVIDGKRQWIYKLEPPQDGRAKIFEVWLTRDKEAAEKAEGRELMVSREISPYGLKRNDSEMHTKTPIYINELSVQCAVLSAQSTQGKESPVKQGHKVSKRGSLGAWVVESIAGSVAQVRQLSGWAAGILFEVDISELTPVQEVMTV